MNGALARYRVMAYVVGIGLVILVCIGVPLRYGANFPLVVEIVKFFKTGKPPVSAEETIEIFAFMEAADESKRQGGRPVSISEVMSRARAQAAQPKSRP